MTVGIILAAKGREVITIEPGASLAEAVRLLAERRIGAALILGADLASSASSPSATSCGLWLKVALPRSTNRSAGT